MGICTLKLEGLRLTALDESGTQVLDLQLNNDMTYSRAASTFHTIETGPKVGVALYFGSQGSDEWFDALSVPFAEAIEAELLKVGSTPKSKSVAAPAVPSRARPPPAMPAPAPKSPPVSKKPAKTKATGDILRPASIPASVAVAVSPGVDENPSMETVKLVAKVDDEAAPPIPDLPPIADCVESRNANDNRATVMLGKAPVLEAEEEENNDEVATPELSRAAGGHDKDSAAAANEESKGFDFSGDCNFATMENLPELPKLIPPAQSKEYKNYMKLKYEMARRNPDMAPPNTASPRPPPVSARRGTAGAKRAPRPPPLKRAATPPSVRAPGLEVTAPRQLSPESNTPVVLVAAPIVEIAENQSQETTPRNDSEDEKEEEKEQSVSAPETSAAGNESNDNSKLERSSFEKGDSNISLPVMDDSVSDSEAISAPILAQLREILQFPDGSRYLGESSAGLKHGQGLLIYCDGSTYEGGFRQGKRSGLGTRTTSLDKSIFHGVYGNDEKQGPGWAYGEDGSELFCYYQYNEKHGCGSFRWPRGAVVDREYMNGTLVATHKTDETTWPPEFAINYAKPDGQTRRIEWSSNAKARLVCVLGSWDDFSKVVPLGVDHQTNVHSVSLVLADNVTFTYRVILDGSLEPGNVTYTLTDE